MDHVSNILNFSVGFWAGLFFAVCLWVVFDSKMGLVVRFGVQKEVEKVQKGFSASIYYAVWSLAFVVWVVLKIVEAILLLVLFLVGGLLRLLLSTMLALLRKFVPVGDGKAPLDAYKEYSDILYTFFYGVGIGIWALCELAYAIYCCMEALCVALWCLWELVKASGWNPCVVVPDWISTFEQYLLDSWRQAMRDVMAFYGREKQN